MERPGLSRRVAAILYDSLLLVALLFLATALVLPLNGGKAYLSGQPLYPLYLLVVSFLFFGWFWTHGGQTLGLKTWKMRILTEGRQPISWGQALIRFIVALLSWGLLGMGFLWIVIDKKRRSWHDLASGTAIFLDK